MPPRTPASGTTRARVHLEVLGQERVVEVPYREGPSSLDDLLRAARALSASVTSIVLEAERAEGHQPSCRRGCIACCKQLIPISVVEARALARALAALPPKRRSVVRARFRAVVARLVEEGLLVDRGDGRHVLASAIGSDGDARSRWLDASQRYFALGLECPFLVDRACSVREHAPLVCREYFASTPAELCDRLDGGARIVPRPIRTSESLASVAADVAGVDDALIPLFLSLEWSEAEGRALDGTYDGERLCEALFAAIDDEHARPFEDR